MIVTLLLVPIVIILVIVWAVRKEQQRFAKMFPPISDDEFLARWVPRTRPEVALRMRRIVAENLGVAYDQINPSSRFFEDIGAK